jgi:hypothetical protein
MFNPANTPKTQRRDLGETMMTRQNMMSLAFLSVLAALLVVVHQEAMAEPQTANFEVAPSGIEQVNLEGLRASLRETDAIGIMTKLSLKRKLDSLLEHFGDYHKGRSHQTLLSLREKFAGLLASTLSLLQDDDPQLFSKLWDAQGHLWLIVSDPVRFQAAVSKETSKRLALRRQD